MYPFAVVTDIGRRTSMEDAYVLLQDIDGAGWIFGGVYDGHGGSSAAKYASEHLHKEFLRELAEARRPGDAFISAYHKISQDLAHQDSGACASTFWLKDGVLTAANAGDSRILVVRESLVLQMTTDHRLENEGERERVVKMGGRPDGRYVYRGDYGLMPTRTLGDEYFKPVGVIATPDVQTYDLGPEDLWILNACDGIFDVMENEEVAELLLGFSDSEEAAKALKHEVLANRKGRDNLTIVLLRIGS